MPHTQPPPASRDLTCREYSSLPAEAQASASDRDTLSQLEPVLETRRVSPQP